MNFYVFFFFVTVMACVIMGYLKDIYVPILQFKFVARATDNVFK
jgi:hypothetical protein